MPHYTFDEVRDKFLKVPKNPLYYEIPTVNSSEEFASKMDELLREASIHDLANGKSSDISKREYEQLMLYIGKGLASDSSDIVKTAKQYNEYINSMLKYDQKNPPIKGSTDIRDDDLIQELYNDVYKKAQELAELENPSFIDNIFGNKNERSKKIQKLQQEITLMLNQWYLEIHKKITNKAFVSVNIVT